MDKQVVIKVDSIIDDGSNQLSYYLKECNLLKVIDVFKDHGELYNNIIYRVRDLSRMFLDRHIDYLEANGLEEYMLKFHTNDYKKIIK